MTSDPKTLAAPAIATDSERLRVLVEAVTEYAIYLLAPDGTVMSWNPGAERLKGYAHGEIVGEHMSCFYISEDVASGRPERNLETARREGVCVDDGWRVRKDGSTFWAHIVITPLMDGGEVRGFAKVTRDDSSPRAAAARADALHAINSLLLEGAGTEAILTVVAASARKLVGASAAWISTADGRGHIVRAAEGPIVPSVGAQLSDIGLLRSLESSEPCLALDNIGPMLAREGLARLGPAVVIPLRIGAELTGGLVVAALSGAAPFDDDQRRFLMLLASQTAVVLAHESKREATRLDQLSDERERIASDLHETVISELFGTGMELESIVMRVQDPALRPRLEQSVERIDRIISRIRQTVFEMARIDRTR